MGVVQACIISVFGVLLALQFKHTKTEYGIYMGVAISIFIFAAIADSYPLWQMRQEGFKAMYS